MKQVARRAARRAAAVALLGVVAASPAGARARLYAVVVAQNRSLDPGVKPLQFADDDGVKTWELLTLFSDRASLFVVPDRDTARLHPEAAARAEVPERAAILERLARYNAEMAADLARGDEPELLFFYAGHGDVDGGGQGYVNLHDGRLTRGDLYRDVIAPSKARFVNVIVDACKSYFMVNARGGSAWVDDRIAPNEDPAERVRAFLEAERLEQYPRAGVIVATSGAEGTHEWSRFRGGILSHELRSALAGAADVNDDGRIEYSELRAFLAAANARLSNPAARIDVFARPPAVDLHRALVDLGHAGAGARRLRFGAELQGRYSLEDDRGVRWVDLNKEPGLAFDVVVPRGRAFYLRHDDAEQAAIAPGDGAHVDLARVSWQPVALAERGALEESFRRDLYQVQFGRRFYDGYVATSGDTPVAEPLVARARPPSVGRHLVGAGYVLSGAPAGDVGASHGASLRYGCRLGHRIDVGLAGEIGYGAGDPGAAPQRLLRAALLGTFGFEHRPLPGLGLRLDAAVGWQLLSGAIRVADSRVEGSEPRGLRLEVAGGLWVRLVGALGVLARGGLAVDGTWPAALPATTRASGFLDVGFRVEL